MYKIIFATDRNYLPHLYVTLKSFFRYNEKDNFSIYILYSAIDGDLIKEYQKLLIRRFDSITFVELGANLGNSIPLNEHFTLANYYRLFIPNIVEAERTLYLDSDIILNDSITPLFSIDFDNNVIAAVEDSNTTIIPELRMNKDAKYFNSGVLMINNTEWLKQHITERVIDFSINNPKAIRFADQCGLNSIVNGEWKKLPKKYNCQSNDLKEELNSSSINQVIIHYTGSSKPWHFRNKHPLRKLYFDNLNFSDILLLLKYYNSRKELLSVILTKIKYAYF